MLEKTVAALKADKAKTILFGKRRAEVPEHCETRSGNAARAQVSKWPITTDVGLEPNVGFRGTADIVRSGHQANR
jgi:hypothetical protein